LFAIVPAILLAAGASGLLMGDPEVRAHLTRVIMVVMPPLQGLIDVILEEAARDAGAVSVVGAVTLLWGASRFVVAFLDAFSRINGRELQRGVVVRNTVAFAAVVAMIGAVVLGGTLAGLSSFLDAAQSSGALTGVGDAVALALAFVPIAITGAAVVLVFRLVPLPTPSWRSVLVPAAVVTIALLALERLFVYFAPRLIGAAALLGTIATVFAALAWLGLSFQAVLLGASWISEREIREREIRDREAEAGSGAGQPP
jgi:YihY family inner membrane protein